MINEASVQAVNASWLNTSFRKPLYASYNFSQIPATVEHLLTGEGEAGLPDDVLGDMPRQYQKVIFLYVDAFGWRFFEKYADRYPFLQRFTDHGVVSKLTSQFPSTTAAHITAIHTGLPPGETGIYEWYYYEPLLDRIIAPLIFSYAGDDAPGTITLPRRFNMQSLFPYETIHQRLSRQSVKSYVFQHASYTPSTYSNLVLAGAKAIPYKTLSEALVHLAQAVNAETEKAYFYFYFDAIDSIGHVYGPDSREFDAEVNTFMISAEMLLHEALSGQTKDTLLLVSADHGQVNISPETTVYINKVMPSIGDMIKRNDDGRLLAPAGSPRDMFLHIREERLDEAFDLLTNLPELQGKAKIYKVSDLIHAGYFSAGRPSERFLERVANLVILSYDGQSAYWYQKGRYEQEFYGHHGGLVPGEMDIPLLALAY